MYLLFAIITLNSSIFSKPAVNDVPWMTIGGDPGGSGYSNLDQINHANVHRLKLEWTFRTGDAAGDTPIQCTPIIVERTMYVVTSGHRIVALNPENGQPKWSFDTHNDPLKSAHSKSSRGVAYWSDRKLGGKRRVLFGTPDGRILSVDAILGKQDPNFKTVDLRSELGLAWRNAYVGVSSAPVIYDNLVYVGIANGEDEGSAPGTIMAFSVETGDRVWSFDVVPQRGQFGSETWSPEYMGQMGGAGAWNGYVLDQKRGILFATTGSATPDFDGRKRIGDNLFANCILALDARTGKRLWHFQTVHHDLWDHDNASRPVLCSVKRGSKTIDAVSVVTKKGYCFVFDRVSGKPIFGIREVPAQASSMPGERASSTQPEPILPPALSETIFTSDMVTNISPQSKAYVSNFIQSFDYGKKYLPPTSRGTIVAPGYFGGSPWSGASFDPRTNTLFVNTNNVPAIVSQPANYRFLLDQEGYPGIKPPWGSLTAIDLSSGAFRWRVPLGEYRELTRRGIPITGTVNLGGTLATAGRLVFVGATCDQRFRAFDAKTGRLLLELPLPASAFAAPATYSINGKQYVVIAASGGGYAKVFGFDKGPVSDTFLCFKLSK